MENSYGNLPIEDFYPHETRSYCMLQTGDIVKYDLCCKNSETYKDDKNYIYIGCGVIHMIDGIYQKNYTVYHFYKKSENV